MFENHSSVKFIQILKKLIIAYFLISSIAGFADNGNKTIYSLIDSANINLKQNDIGGVTYIWTSKPILTEKVYKSYVQLYFNKKLVNQDSLGSFILIMNNKFIQVLYQNQLYTTDTSSKIIKIYSTDTIEYKTLESLVRSYCKRLFRPFIRTSINPTHLPPDYYRCIIKDTLINQISSDVLMLLDSNEIYSYDSTYIYFSKNDHRLVKYYRKSFDKEALDYQRIIFDSIEKTENTIIDIKGFLDSLIARGYSVEYQNPYSASFEESKKMDTLTYAPNFQLKNYSGNSFDLRNAKSKLVLIDFSYMSCYYCFKSIPLLNNLYQKYTRNDLIVFWVDPVDGKSKPYAEAFFKRKGLLFPIYYDDDQSVTSKYNINVFPSIFIIELPSLHILGKYIGYTSENEDKILKLIESKIN